ncbi:MAG: hypothetical protein K9H25_02610 [Rhodospirillum sp.]|nr:hypothetical protein [Rhodospirillum sp.]MCF8488547.1 hypothetical protein [Rhodospirillum sp.]MCF8499143.1 hypothetical protein [Rhodospirillum sp.]
MDRRPLGDPPTEQVDHDALLRQARLDHGIFMRSLCRGLVKRLRGDGFSMNPSEANAR